MSVRLFNFSGYSHVEANPYLVGAGHFAQLWNDAFENPSLVKIAQCSADRDGDPHSLWDGHRTQEMEALRHVRSADFLVLVC